MSRPLRSTKIVTSERVDVGQRVSIGLISLSLAMITLALGVAFLSNPAALLVVPSSETHSEPSTATAVTLGWTAPGDDANIGQATSYEIRYSTSPLTAINFASATLAPDPPVPQTAGSQETFSVTNLNPETTYFFALKTTDEAGNVSDLSNIATKTTDALPEACVPTYSCSAWSTCIGGVQTRTCSVTNSCEPGLDAPITSQSCTVPEPPPDDPVPPPPPPPPPSPPPPPPSGGTSSVLQNPLLVAGVAGPTVPVARIIDPRKKSVLREWLTFSRTNKTGINVAYGDVSGDLKAEVIVGTGAGSDPLVKIFNDRGQLLTQFNPYPTSRGIGVAVVTGDVDGNGVDEIITVPAKSAAHVRVFKYQSSTKRVVAYSQVFAYESKHRNGFNLAASDLNLDGRDEIIVAARTDGSSVSVFKLGSNRTLQRISRFSPYGKTFSTGLTVAAGDVNGDGRGEILVVPGPGYYADVKVMTLSGKLINHFLPMPTSYRGGIDLATFDYNKDGREEIYTVPYDRGDPALRVFRWNSLKKIYEKIQTYFVFPRTMKDGLRIDAAPHI